MLIDMIIWGITRTIMNDYQSNNCVGKYLKNIHEIRVKKNTTENSRRPRL